MSGPEALSIEDETRYARHDEAMVFLGELASSDFGVDFSESTVANWKQAHRVIMDVDDVFDRADSDKQGAQLALLAIFKDGAVSAETKPEASLDEQTLRQCLMLRAMLNDEQSANFVTKGLRVIAIGQEMQKVESPRELARLTMLEGQMTATMLLHLIDPADLDQANLPDFIRFLRIASRVANVIDSVADLKADFDSGITKLKPNFSNRALMSWEILPDAKRSISALGLLAVLKKMPSATHKVLADRKRKPAVHAIG